MPANFYLDFKPFGIENMAVRWKNIYFNYILIFLKKKIYFSSIETKKYKKGIVKKNCLNFL